LFVFFRCIIVNKLRKFVVVIDDDNDNTKVVVVVVVVVAAVAVVAAPAAVTVYRNIQSRKPAADRNCTVCAGCKSDSSIHISGT
jgi:Na+-transporting NADH:ubiquinone oxidoreductase subunit NqrC